MFSYSTSTIIKGSLCAFQDIIKLERQLTLLTKDWFRTTVGDFYSVKEYHMCPEVNVQLQVIEE